MSALSKEELAKKESKYGLEAGDLTYAQRMACIDFYRKGGVTIDEDAVTETVIKRGYIWSTPTRSVVVENNAIQVYGLNPL